VKPSDDAVPESPAPPAVHDVHQRARRGIRLLLGRQALVLVLTFSGGVVLSRALAPADFGVFGIALFVIILMNALTELGLQPALIQRAGVLPERELRTAFAIEAVAITLAIALLWPAAALLPRLYVKASPDLVWLVRLMSVELYLAAARDLSETLLERGLRYERLAAIDVAGSIVYNAVAIVLAVTGHGAWSLAIGMMTSSALRTVLVYRAAPWPVRPAFDVAAARALLRSGVPVQISRIVSSAQFWVTPTLVASLIGPGAVGLLQWAAGNGRKPLDFIENIVRVSLPHFSLLQDDVDEVERILGRYVVAFVLACGLWFVVLAVAGYDLVLLVYTARWTPAVAPMIVYAAGAVLTAGRVIVGAALVGLGRMVFTARVTTIGAVTTIVASVALVLTIGFMGVPLGQLAGAAVMLPWLVAGLGPGALGRVLLPATTALLPMGAALAVGGAVHLAPLSPPLRGLLTAGVMTLVYAAVTWWAGPPWLRATAWDELAVVRAAPQPEAP
jgi:PST family polysaccharide transporter